MSPQLREALRAAADAAGCSLNAFAIQILAAAAGDARGFRGHREREPEVQEIERDATGFPKHWRARAEHSGARTKFMEAMERERPDEWVALVKKYDREDPGYFVAWRRRREAAEPDGRRGAA
jgi:hypothetical protein